MLKITMPMYTATFPQDFKKVIFFRIAYGYSLDITRMRNVARYISLLH